MALRTILDALRSVPVLRRAGGRRPSFRPRLEALDGRWVPSFSPAVNYAAGAYPTAVVAADFDGDGTFDLAVADNGAATVSVLLGNGDGTFQAAIESATGYGPISMAVGDFNGDTVPDLATANGGDVSVLLGHGDGTFDPPASIPLWDGSGAQSVAVGDFNGDGKMDLGVASNLYNPGYWYYGWYGSYWQPGYYTGGAHVLMGDGLGSFSDASSTDLGYGYHGSAAVADFNGDGNTDFALVNFDYWAIDVLAGDGAGNLSWLSELSAGGPATSVAAADMNGDGNADLVTPNGYYNTVGVLLGNGLGGFGSAQTFATGSYPASVAIADFNADGMPDIATANFSSQNVSVVLGRGNGTFSPPTNSTAGVNPWGVVAADFNGDGWPDAAATNYSGGDASVLINDHAWPAADAPSVSIGDVTVTEGNTGSLTATFKLSLSAAYGQSVTVHYTTADGSATDGSDYSAGSADVIIPAGQTSQTFTVSILGDRLPEPSEYFYVNLTGAANAFIADSQAVATILDNEPRITINDVTVTEGNTGSANATVTVSLSVAYDEAVTVHYDLADGSATSGSDYTAGSGDVTVAAGQTSKTFTVAILGDRVFESTETVLVNLSSPSSNAAISDPQGIVSILDNEPRITINDVQRNEGNGNGNGKNSNTTAFTFTVSLSASYDQSVTVSFATANGTATVADNDYIANSGTLTFAPGETTKTIIVSVKGDKKREADEWFAVNLSGASSNAQISDPTGIGWIMNDDKH